MFLPHTDPIYQAKVRNQRLPTQAQAQSSPAEIQLWGLKLCVILWLLNPDPRLHPISQNLGFRLVGQLLGGHIVAQQTDPCFVLQNLCRQLCCQVTEAIRFTQRFCRCFSASMIPCTSGSMSSASANHSNGLGDESWFDLAWVDVSHRVHLCAPPESLHNMFWLPQRLFLIILSQIIEKHSPNAPDVSSSYRLYKM